MDGTIIEVRPEKDDDNHVAIEDGQGHHLIGEFPHPGCAAGSPPLAAIKLARKQALTLKVGHPRAGGRLPIVDHGCPVIVLWRHQVTSSTASWTAPWASSSETCIGAAGPASPCRSCWACQKLEARTDSR